MADVNHHHGGYGNSFAIILVLFVLLAIIGCTCYGGFGGGYGYC